LKGKNNFVFTTVFEKKLQKNKFPHRALKICIPKVIFFGDLCFDNLKEKTETEVMRTWQSVVK